jgi:hypothetical protein
MNTDDTNKVANILSNYVNNYGSMNVIRLKLCNFIQDVKPFTQ